MTPYPISWSKIEVFLRCRLGFKGTYIDWPRPPYVQSDPAKIGEHAHALVEQLLTARLAGTVETYDDVTTFLRRWGRREDGCPLDMTPLPKGGHESLMQAAVQLVERNLHHVGEVSRMLRESEITGLEAGFWYDEGGVRIDPGLPRKAVMQAARWGGDIDAYGVTRDHVEVVDLKSGRTAPKEEQLWYYVAALAEWYPHLRTAAARFVLLAHDEVREVPIDLRDARKWARSIRREIEKEKAFAPNPGKPQCDWCKKPCDQRAV